MQHRSIIRQFLAGIMLIIFAFSITPKKALHDWLANHTDKTAAPVSDGNAHFSLAGFNCDCDNLVAESPFTGTADRFEFTAPQVFASRQAFKARPFYPATQFFFSLRGPPAALFI